MGRRKVENSQLGLLINTRRKEMHMTLSGLSRELGGSPSMSFLSRLESGEITPTVQLAHRLAEILDLPPDAVLNAAGHATPDQRQEGIEALREVALAPAPIMAYLPVIDPEHPTDPPKYRRHRMVRDHSDTSFVTDLTGDENEPYTGEVLFVTGIKPVDRRGVVAEVDGRLSAWTYRVGASGPYLVNGTANKITDGYVIRGVITRVTLEKEW